MERTSWQLAGQYFETCNCDFLCPCLPSNMQATPTHGECDVALVFHVEHGRYGDVNLDGLNFVVVAKTPDAMGKGNWTVGLITDERARPDQQEALVKVASGQSGGPMAALAPLIGTFGGVEVRPIHFEHDGMRSSVAAGDLVDQALVGVGSASDPEQPMYLTNSAHPANSQLALAHASRSHIHAFGIDWDDESGRNNGHFAPFDWHGEPAD